MAQEQASGVGSPAPQTGAATTAPFVLSLIAGILILAGGGMMSAFGSGWPYGMMGGYGGNYYWMMGGFGYTGWFYAAAIIGLVSGVGILVGAVMMYSRPRNTPTWGLVVLAFSILSFFGMGGFFIGAILGVLGGVLAMVSKPEVTRS